MIQKEILLPEQMKILSEEGNKGEYEIDKLYPGYGHTLGNSLRRIILSSIPGVGITKIKIDGVPHEFSTIEGIKEDVINIVLNLKRIVFKMHTDNEIELELKVKKSGEIKASDIELPSQVEIVNPDQYLFSLEKNKEVKINFTIQKGLGYVSKEAIKGKEKLKPGEIIMDTSFTPIRRVSYKVNLTRVGERTDFNKINLFVETDGSVSPTEAVVSSIKIMIEQMKAVLGGGFEENSEDNKTIASLNLNNEILEKIAGAGIIKISDLKEMSDDEILAIDGIEEEDLKKIKESLK